jgi:hypothetical protein
VTVRTFHIGHGRYDIPNAPVGAVDLGTRGRTSHVQFRRVSDGAGAFKLESHTGRMRDESGENNRLHFGGDKLKSAER